jgi:hypothetical protein
MSFGYGPAGDPKEMTEVIRGAVERGVTFFDTAQAYGPFTNEELVGEALAPFRKEVVIATKFGFRFEQNGAPLSTGLDSRPETIKQRAEGSLKRLIPVRRYLRELIDLIWKGKINPGQVFDLILPLDQVAEGYRAMDERRAIKTLLRPAA